MNASALLSLHLIAAVQKKTKKKTMYNFNTNHSSLDLKVWLDDLELKLIKDSWSDRGFR